MERTVLVLFVITALALVIILSCYVVTFRGGLSNDHDDWGSFGSLVGGLSMLLFSLANIKIWLYQSRKNDEAMKHQVKLQERLTLLTGLQSKLLFVAKIHTEHIFDNNDTLINNAFSTLEALDQTWKKYNLTADLKKENIVTDISNPGFQKELSQCEEPLLALLKFYREQVK
jgi:hypothetical protein